MSLTDPTLADPIRPEDAWKQAADRVTPFSQYLGEKLLGGLEAMRPVQALEQAMLPPRSGVPDEYGFVAPPGPSPVLDKTAWEASPHFRPGIEYDAGMTEARAEALATQKDRLDWNKSLVERYQGGHLGEAAGFVAGLAPGVADPTNYIPLLGPAAKAAMVARLGVIGGNVGLHAAEAAANTALFEPLTASHAATFGQPYGWQDAAADVALGALAGSVGGAIHGGLEYRGSLREAATRTRLETVMAAADATSLAAEQNDRGLPVDVAPVLAGRLPAAPPGRVVRPSGPAEDVALTAGGQRVPVRYELAEARDLIASHTADMAVNPAYPPELQPRDRTRAASQAQVQQMAANLEPALLGRSPTAEAGAPIVGPDGVVESGNARVLALGKAYADKMPGAAAYRDFLTRQGLPAEGMEAPVLIRRRTSDMAPPERAAFARAANVSGVAAMGTAERARSDAKGLKVGDLMLVQSSDMHAAANRPFVRSFMGRLPESERGGLLTASGELSKSGGDRLRAALLAKAFGDPDLVARLAEEPETRLGGLGRALAEIAPKWAAMRVELAVGHIAPEGEGTAALLEALRSIVHSREAGEALHGPLAQGDMLGGGLSRDGAAFLRSFLVFDGEGGSRLASAKRLGEVLDRYVEEARKQQPGRNMFGQAPLTPAELLEGRREAGPPEGGAAPEHITAAAVRVGDEVFAGADHGEAAQAAAAVHGEAAIDALPDTDHEALMGYVTSTGRWVPPAEAARIAAAADQVRPVEGESRAESRAAMAGAVDVSSEQLDMGRPGPGSAAPRGEPSFATATPEAPHPSVAEAARRVGKAEPDPLATFKADAGLEGYQAPLPGHEPIEEPRERPAEKPSQTGLDKAGGEMGKGMVGGMYDMLFDRYRRGETTEAGGPSLVLQVAKAIGDRGRPLTREEFPRLAADVMRAKEGKTGEAFQVAVKDVMRRWAEGAPAEGAARPKPAEGEATAKDAALPSEMAEIEAMKREGSFRPEDAATLAAGEVEAQKAENYAAAWTTLAGCVARAVVA